MKELILAAAGFLGGILAVFLSRKAQELKRPIIDKKTHEDIVKEIYDKNPPIRSKEDILKELNRYRADN